MKKTTVLILCFIVLSCGSTKPIAAKKKEITGKWLVESITDNNKTKLSNDSPLLNDAALVCFYESIWKFDPSTNSGEYNINDLYCSFGNRKFSYLSQQVNELNGYYEFNLKPTEKKKKKIAGKSFNFKLVDLSKDRMQWQHSITLNNKTTIIKINFKKLNKTNITTR